MRVLHLVGGPLNGGAALGAYSLHKALKDAGIYSRILTNSRPVLDDDSVTYIARSPMEKVLNQFRVQANNVPIWFYRSLDTLDFNTGIAGFDFTRTQEFKEADLLHLHWINGGLVNVRHLSRVSKPIVWTLRDMWPMTGGCHHAADCDNYKQSCGNCWQLKRRGPHDLSRWVLRRKLKYVPRSTVVVGMSHWLAERAMESAVFRGFDVRLIPNNVNTDDFFPLEKEAARSVLGLRTKKKIILAGAQSLKSFYKGFDKFLDALKMLRSEDYFLIFFGRLDEQAIKSTNFEFKNFGFLHDVVSLRLVYSAADVFVAPSMMEAFGKTIAESMACGTPVVCFDATGQRDIVDHQFNGYKARPFDTADLARGIQWILESGSPALGDRSREKIVATFDSRIIAKKYKELYEELVHT